MLKLYNPLLPIKVSCDDSEKYLGAVLEQFWYPIGYTSYTSKKS